MLARDMSTVTLIRVLAIDCSRNEIRGCHLKVFAGETLAIVDLFPQL